MLRVENVVVKYDDAVALQAVNFDVVEGEIGCIVGSNGAGKTTILNTISGIIRLSAGKITFEETDITGFPSHTIVEMGIIQVPEGRLLFPDMSVLENLELGGYGKRTRHNLGEKLDFVFELLPRLRERKSQLAGTLSGGEQQMLAIARGLMGSPRLLMFDEPSLGLAPIVVEQVFETIAEINRNGVTILLVEQNVFRSLEMSDRAFVLENGKTVMEGDAKSFLEDEKIKDAYLGL